MKVSERRTGTERGIALRPSAKPKRQCHRDFVAWLKTKNLADREYHEVVSIWRRLPRNGRRVLYPGVIAPPRVFPRVPGGGVKLRDGEWDWLTSLSPELLAQFTQWILDWYNSLKQATYYIDIWNDTTYTIPELVVTYFLNELTDSNQIIAVGPYPATWPNFQPGQKAEFAISGCLYVRSYAVTLVWEDGIDEVLPNTPIQDINALEKAEEGYIDMCGDIWEIYV